MRLWKLDDNGILIKAVDMSEEEAVAAGYKPLEWTPEPEDGAPYDSRWAEGESTIYREWYENEPEPTDTDKAEAYDILVGAAE